MTDNMIPDDIRQFILQHIQSIAQVEGLLLLRSDRQKEWSADTITQRLYIRENEGSLLLAQLFETGLLAVSEADSSLYRYQPSSPELEQMVDRLADIYSRYLLPVTHLIHSKPKTRIQEFAEAFRIRKE